MMEKSFKRAGLSISEEWFSCGLYERKRKWKGYMNYWREAGETEWRSCRFLTELH